MVNGVYGALNSLYVFLACQEANSSVSSCHDVILLVASSQTLSVNDFCYSKTNFVLVNTLTLLASIDCTAGTVLGRINSVSVLPELCCQIVVWECQQSLLP